MRALVTGATGFVGSHLTELLVRRGDTVTALVRTPRKATLLDQLGIRQVQGSLHDRAALERATADQEVIFHVAGMVAGRDEEDFLKGNRDGVRNLILASAPATRFVLVSSMAAGGPSAPGRPLTGSEAARPVTAYGRSKLAGEEEVRRSALPWTIVRPPMVYGPRDTEVLKVFKLTGLRIAPIFGDGRQELSAITGPDLAQALVAAAGTATVGGTYVACHPQIFTSGDFVRAVAQAMGHGVTLLPLPEPVARVVLGITGSAARLAGQTTILTSDKANEFYQAAWTGDPGPLTAATGWRAGHDLATGLALTATWYRDAGWL